MLVTSRAYPEVREGWTDWSQWRAYRLTASHGKRTVAISMPADRFMAMSKPERDTWLQNARARCASGHV